MTRDGLLRIDGINDAPIVVDDMVTVDEDGQITLNVLSNDIDPDNDMLNFSFTPIAANGVVSINLDNTLTYKPSANFNGNDGFNYTITDGLTTSQATVLINVNAINDDPVAAENIFLGKIGLALSMNPLVEAEFLVDGILTASSDIEGDSLTVSAVEFANPNLGGSIAIDPVSGASQGDYIVFNNDEGNIGSGTVSLIYTLIDGNGGEDDGTAFLTINAPAVANTDQVTTDEDVPIVISVLDNDSDSDDPQDALQIVDSTQPANGTVSFNPNNNTFLYTPDDDFFGIDTFDYGIFDGYDISVGRVDITVNAVNDSPTLQLTSTISQLDENSDISQPLAVAQITLIDDNLGNNVLSLSGSDANLFTLQGTTLLLQQGIALDYESKPIISVDINVDDPTVGGTIDDSVTYQLTLNDILPLFTGNNDMVDFNSVDAKRLAETSDLYNALAGNDIVALPFSNNLPTGYSASQFFSGGEGNDTITGRDLADNILASVGTDSIDGGSNSDTFSYYNTTNAGTTMSGGLEVTIVLTSGAVIDLEDGTAQQSGFGNDTLMSIENAIGTGLNDTITGSIGVNRLEGGDGDDRFAGLAGNDTIIGGEGNDIYFEGLGNDTFDGGNGSDTLSYSNVTEVTINSTTVSLSGGAVILLGAGQSSQTELGTESLTGVENAYGTGLADIIFGTNDANELEGGDGNDTLVGFAGEDILIGGQGDDLLIIGEGNDVLRGGDEVFNVGAGSDTFRFTSDSLQAGEVDTIIDWDSSDEIDLSAFTIPSKAFIGYAETGGDLVIGSFYFSGNIVLANTNLNEIDPATQIII